ncbi:MAG: glucokinase [Gammaproteobacteria bacterium]|nr:glucokinase [Gammaproteobacteria bacterium]
MKTDLLIGDIGGTKTLLKIIEINEQGQRTVRQQRYESAAYEDFQSLVSSFLRAGRAKSAGSDNETVEAACIAVAGPVQKSGDQQQARVTNLPWRLESEALQCALQIPVVRLINDFEAVGYGIAALTTQDLLTLQAGQVREHAPRAVIGAGTGLGMAQLVWCAERYQMLPSEGGHAHFAPVNKLQLALADYLQQRIGEVSVESVLSGPGLVRIYEFLCDHHARKGGLQESPAVRDAMLRGDKGAAITAAAEHNYLANQALQLFVEIYGSHAGNLALTTLPFGGLYIAGGIAPKIKAWLDDGRFMSAFCSKSKMGGLLEQIPVHVVLNADVGLLGAASVARQALAPHFVHCP